MINSLNSSNPHEPPFRRHCLTVEAGDFAASVGFDLHGRPCEVFLTSRGKSDSDLDCVLKDLSIAISKAMQGDESETIPTAILDDHAPKIFISTDVA